MHTHEIRFDVRYAETDAMAVVHHSRYLPWLELGRTEWLKSLGMHYAEIERQGYFLVISEVGLRYLRPARYGDTVVVQTRMEKIRSRHMRFEYEIRRDGSDERLVTAFTEHILTDRAGALRRFPPELLALIQQESEG